MDDFLTGIAMIIAGISILAIPILGVVAVFYIIFG